MYVLILPGEKLGCERLQIFMVRRSELHTTFGLVANFIYKVTTFERSLQASRLGTGSQKFSLVESQRIISRENNGYS